MGITHQPFAVATQWEKGVLMSPERQSAATLRVSCHLVSTICEILELLDRSWPEKPQGRVFTPRHSSRQEGSDPEVSLLCDHVEANRQKLALSVAAFKQKSLDEEYV